MKFKTKLFTDRFIGRVLCFFFGILALLLGRILRRSHQINADKIKVVVIAKYFGIGSITHAIPLIKALKEKYNKAQICFITRKNNKEFMDLVRYIDKQYFIDDSSFISFCLSNIKLLFSLWRLKIDLFFDLEVFSSYGALVTLFSLSRVRFGFFFPHSSIFKSWIYTHLLYFNFRIPLRLSYIQLGRLGGVDENASFSLIPFDLEQETLKNAESKLNILISNKDAEETGEGRGRILLINANASELSFARRWNIENFAKTAQHFSDLGYTVLFLGANFEKDYIENALTFIKKHYGNSGNVYNAAGLFSLKETLALFLIGDVFLTNDSGLMNLGYAQGIKTCALYGANAPHFVHIDDGINIAVYKKSYCSPCLYIFDNPPCGEQAVCMENIILAEVIEAVENLFKEKQPLTRKIKESNVISKYKDYIMGTLRIR